MSAPNFINSLASYIEILGFKERASALDDEFDLPSLAALDADVAAIQNHFDYKSTNVLALNIERALNQKILAFYDCLVISVDLQTAIGAGFTEFNLLRTQLMRLAYAQGRCVLEGTFLSGGANKGLWYYEADQLVSPAMVTAYSTKEKCQQPFIALHPDLYQSLLKHPDRGDAVDTPLPILQKAPKGDFWVLDYLSLRLIERQWYSEPDTLKWFGNVPEERKSLLKSIGWNSDAKKWLDTHASVIRQGFNDALDKESQDQFRDLASYHNEVVRRWDIDVESYLIDLTSPTSLVLIASSPPPARQGAANPVPHLAVFVDILGFSFKVMETVKASDPTRAIEEVQEKISRIQTSFEHNATDSLTTGAHKAAGIKVLAFSDCIVIGASLVSEYAQATVRDAPVGAFPYDAVMTELGHLALCQQQCVLKGIFLRGGIDVGAWSQHGDRLISPALSRAYDLEGEVVMPILGLTERLVRLLGEYADPHSDSLQTAVREYNTDGLHFWYLDYIWIRLESMEWQSYDPKIDDSSLYNSKQEMMEAGYVRNTHRWLDAHSEAIRYGYGTVISPKDKKKYEWLAWYHNDTMSRIKPAFRRPLLIL